jgi:hypothetical protein
MQVKRDHFGFILSFVLSQSCFDANDGFMLYHAVSGAVVVAISVEIEFNV